MKNTILQYFEWYLPEDAAHWKRLKAQAKMLRKIGIRALWLPPAYKGNGGRSEVGYAVYDMYDLGEFDQKGTVPTKYGSVDEYLDAIETAHKADLKVYADIVFNHKIGADRTENFKAWPVNEQDRNQLTGGLEPIEAWTKFDYSARKGKYSTFVWDWTCFKGTDYNALTKQNGLWLFEGKKWDANVSREMGNYDYVMGDDTDFNDGKVKEELIRWGKWYQGLTGIDGYRIDCVKSIDSTYFGGWLDEMDNVRGGPAFAVGEYWSGDINDVLGYLEQSRDCMHLFDVPLHYRMQQVSWADGNYDLRTLFDGTITELKPDKSVPFVDNHDTQPHQALESWIPAWFKPMAYASILLRNYENPCVFYGDLYGIDHDQIAPTNHLHEMIWIREHYLSDQIQDFVDDDPQKVTWVARGEHPVAVILSIGEDKQREIVLPELANAQLHDIFSGRQIQFDSDGRGVLQTDPGSGAVYLKEEDYQVMEKEMQDIFEEAMQKDELKDPASRIFGQ